MNREWAMDQRIVQNRKKTRTVTEKTGVVTVINVTGLESLRGWAWVELSKYVSSFLQLHSVSILKIAHKSHQSAR